jgi:hypothetical protein
MNASSLGDAAKQAKPSLLRPMKAGGITKCGERASNLPGPYIVNEKKTASKRQSFSSLPFPPGKMHLINTPADIPH